MEKLIKSKERRQKYGEVFTPAWLVKDMCDMVQNEAEPGVDVYAIHTTFLEPACGNGNFLLKNTPTQSETT